ncbi:MAG: pyrroline-5-carboxylate reductase [Xanthobacteraceae bacterium]|jgi:pyrroline-5-carboxylate reductase
MRASDFQPQTAALAQVDGKILLVGAGKMGTAILEGWLGLGLSPSKLIVLEPDPSAQLSVLAAQGLTLNPDRAADQAVVAALIAVKPQTAPEVMPHIVPFLGDGTVVVSIMAGRTLRFISSILPKAAIVRAMPNVAASIGRGITVAIANSRVAAAQRDLVHELLSAVGVVEWTADEDLLDAVTAVSGSGPAYVFLLAECMARAGVLAGLPAGLAERLANATVAGAGELLARSGLDPATLRQNVTSPGGTTAAALDVLMSERGLQPLLTEAIAAATRRSRQLAE